MVEYVTPTIIGLGIVSITMLLVFDRLEEKHWPLKLMILFFVVSLMLLVPKSAVDGSLVCEPVVSNSTEISASVVAYEYESFCFQREESTTYTFLRRTQVMYYIIVAWAVIFLGIAAIMKLNESWKARGRR